MPERLDPSQIPEGTEVTADHADFGDQDISKPVVAGTVEHPETGEPALRVRKPGIFPKDIIVPADRIEGEQHGRVVIDLDEGEADKLSAFGTSVVPPREDSSRDHMSGVVADPPPGGAGAAEREPITAGAVAKALGPGVIAGAADNDPTTVGTLAVVGSQTTFALAWILVLILPMMASIQAIAAAVGATSGKSLQVLIRDRYGRVCAWIALLFLLTVNVFTLAADLEGGAAALGLILHIHWRFFTLPLAILVAGALLFGSYDVIRRILTCVLFIFLLYIPAAFLAHPTWGAVFRGTFVPHLSLTGDEIAGALALLGTTLTSYVYYWQTIEEVEQPGRRPRVLAMLDASSGMGVATVIFWFILVTTGATVGAHHQTVQTAQDAAGALKPIAGPLAQDLFAGGLLASALLALPVLAGTTAYAVGETLGWSVGLSRQPWRSQGFYVVLVASLLLVVPLTFLNIEPITLLFVSGLIGGIGAPVLLALLLLIASDRRAMQDRPIGGWLKLLGWATAAIVSLATVAYLVSQLV